MNINLHITRYKLSNYLEINSLMNGKNAGFSVGSGFEETSQLQTRLKFTSARSSNGSEYSPAATSVRVVCMPAVIML